MIFLQDHSVVSRDEKATKESTWMNFLVTFTNTQNQKPDDSKKSNIWTPLFITADHHVVSDGSFVVLVVHLVLLVVIAVGPKRNLSFLVK